MDKHSRYVILFASHKKKKVKNEDNTDKKQSSMLTVKSKCVAKFKRECY